MVDDIVPDDKDWTWVLQRTCDECGFDARSIELDEVAAMIRVNAEQWRLLLASGDESSRVRSRPDRWSTLEYGAHVRDVYRLYERRLRLMLDTDDPTYPNWDQDATAIAERYDQQDPVIVAGELVAAASTLAASFDDLSLDDWRRPGRRSDGAQFTIESFARYLVHDPVHHLWDVGVAPA
jgi:DinB superfamily